MIIAEYKVFLIENKKDKTVLVIDDICTQGFTLEAARLFIRQTGANVIYISWLKTINTSYQAILDDDYQFNPSEKIEAPQLRAQSYPYRAFITDHYAPVEISKKIKAYDAWKWPVDV